MLDYAEITSIPPLPLWVLLNADKETTSNGFQAEEETYNGLFTMNTSEDNLDDLLKTDEMPTKFDRKLSLPEQQCISHFGQRQGQILSRLLTHTHLPGLSSLDQMHLLALADTVATCNTDFGDKIPTDTNKLNNQTNDVTTESLDDCGLRYLLAMKHYTYLLRCLPLNQRAQFQKNGIGTSNIVWAFHSESKDELLNLIPSYTKGELKWSTLKDLGVGYWLTNINILRQCIEKLAKSSYQVKQDPLDSAIYYLAMKKKSIVWGLFRSKRDEKMTAFFSNNFSEDRWRKAALKNAFVLLGKQRFEHAVAFFLLANSLNDAIEVCINKLEDFQLALVLARLYEDDTDGINGKTSTFHKLIYEHILAADVNGKNSDLSKAHPDPFLRSMAYWILKNYQESLNTLLLTSVGCNNAEYKDDDLLKIENQAKNPNVFNFYIYLRSHPLLVRQNIALSAQERKLPHVVLSGFSYSADNTTLSLSDKQLQIEDTITSVERQLYFTTAHAHFKAGCPALALEVLNKLPLKVLDDSACAEETTFGKIEDKQIKSGIIDWSTPVASTVQKDEFDWSKPVSSVIQEKPDEDFDWSKPVSSTLQSDADDFDWSKPVSSTLKLQDDFDWNKPVSDIEDDDKSPSEINKNKELIKTVAEVNNSKIDIMAQQLKFVACLKILMEELSTLATGFEVDGGQLRYQLYIWLENEVEALKELCNYRSYTDDCPDASSEYAIFKVSIKFDTE